MRNIPILISAIFFLFSFSFCDKPIKIFQKRSSKDYMVINAQTINIIYDIFGFVTDGKVVTSVSSGKPMNNAGLEVDDYIYRFDNFINRISSNQGKEVDIQIIRNGRKMSISVQIANLPIEVYGYVSRQDQFGDYWSDKYMLISGQIRDLINNELGFIAEKIYMGLTSCRLVQEVFKNSPMDKAGLKVGDCILSLDDNFYNYVISNQGKKMSVPIVRNGQRMYINISIPNFPFEKSGLTLLFLD